MKMNIGSGVAMWLKAPTQSVIEIMTLIIDHTMSGKLIL